MNRRGVYALVLGAVFLVILVAVTAPAGLLWPEGPPSAAAVGEALWLGRWGEVLLQGLLILSGVIAILLLISPARSRREP